MIKCLANIHENCIFLHHNSRRGELEVINLMYYVFIKQIHVFLLFD